MSEQVDNNFPADLGETGKELIAKFRSENNKLKSQLARFEGIDPDKYKEAVSRLGNLEAENKQLAEKITTADAQFDFYTKSSGKIDPQYVDLAWTNLRGELKVSDKGYVIGDAPIDTAIESFVTKYPKFAAASAGSELPRDIKTEPPIKTSVAQSDFLTNLEAIASGKLTVSDAT